MKRKYKKKTPLQKGKKTSWTWFSHYIRRRDTFGVTGEDRGYCCTCGKELTYKTGQAGHFVPGREGIPLFDEECVHLQCYRCNVPKHGNFHEYYDFMLKKYGFEKTEEIRARRKIEKTYTLEELEQIAAYYEEKAKTIPHPGEEPEFF
jgi:hypothetical protein